jgi:SAM-dependent methyltransferase
LTVAPMHGEEPASAWVRRFMAMIRPGGRVLDLASGRGRHVRLLAEAGFRVVALDRDAGALAALEGVEGVETLAADVEAAPWPFAAESFDAIVVTHYLHRPLFPVLREALVPEGVLIYETFAKGNERFGRPSNPDFLLARDELLQAVRPLHVVAFEQGRVESPRPAVVQRICAVRSASELDGQPLPE